MDSARGPTLERLDAAGFWQVWQHFDPEEKGYIEEKELDAFFYHMLTKLGTDRWPVERTTNSRAASRPRKKDFEVLTASCLAVSLRDVVIENVQRVKQRFVTTHDVSKDGHIQMKELASMFLSEDEGFLLLFHQEAPLDSSVEFMQIWRKYDADSSGFISAAELCNFLRDLFLHHKKAISEAKLKEYTGTMMKIFDKNKDGRLDLNDLARILALQENFLLQFKMDACSAEERKRDFEKIFAHYDVSKTGALEGPEVDGFVKDMMELVQPSISGVDLDRFREILLRHCDESSSKQKEEKGKILVESTPPSFRNSQMPGLMVGSCVSFHQVFKFVVVSKEGSRSCHQT
ncbi:Secretagogin [Manis javanica]|nr:Secretagogin [Manis javanica]